jgi:hypothetical protein
MICGVEFEVQFQFGFGFGFGLKGELGCFGGGESGREEELLMLNFFGGEGFFLSRFARISLPHQ